MHLLVVFFYPRYCVPYISPCAYFVFVHEHAVHNDQTCSAHEPKSKAVAIIIFDTVMTVFLTTYKDIFLLKSNQLNLFYNIFLKKQTNLNRLTSYSKMLKFSGNDRPATANQFVR